MKYDSYKDRTIKFVGFLRKLQMHLALVITCAVVCCLIVFGFSFSYGIITDDIDEPFSIQYGESPQLNAKAIFRDVTYEFRKSGETSWSDVQPTIPGEYEVRTVTKRAFGIVGYGKVQQFNIDKKQVDVVVNNDAFVYGDNITGSIELCGNDKLENIEFDINYLSDNKVKVKPIIESIVVENENGENITNYYNYNLVEKELDLTRRKIEISSKALSKEYDGLPLISNEYEITSGSLAYNDELDIKFTESIVNCGTQDNLFEVVITNDEGEDVTDKYDITSTFGVLEVTKRKISITSEDETKVYDGTPLYSTLFTSDNLVDGEVISIIKGSGIIDVGQTDSKIKCVINNGENDVTDNYEIEYIFGTLQITERVVKIETNSVTKIYDGLVLTGSSYEFLEGSICENHELNVTYLNTITNKGSVDNDVLCVIKSADGNDVTFNYRIDVTKGSLVVNPRPIKVSTENQTKIYDGTKLISSGYTLSTGENEGLIEKDTAQVVGELPSILDASEIVNEIKLMFIGTDGKDVSDNYSIIPEFGKLIINKRNIKINSASKTWVYDGVEHDLPEYIIAEDENGGLAEGENIVVEETTKLKDFTKEPIKNEIKINIYNNEILTSKNYVIDLICDGLLEIKKRFLVITTPSEEKIYDGLVLSRETYELNTGEDSGIAPNQELLRTSEWVSIVNQGSILNSIEYDIYDENQVSVKDNYLIDEEFGTLKVLRRQLTVKTADDTKIYDGEKLENHKIITNNTSTTGLATNQSIFVTSIWKYRLDKGTVENTIEYEIHDIDGNVIDKDNYIITDIFGILEVLARRIEIISSSYTWVYDGVEHSYPEYTIFDAPNEGLVKGETITVTKNTIVKDYTPTPVDNELEIKIYKGDGTLSDNYNIIYTNTGKLKIEQRPIIFKTATIHKKYDAADLTAPGYEILGEFGLANNQKLVIKSDYKVVTSETLDVTVVNEIDFTIVDEKSNDVYTNYLIDKQFGTLLIEHRPITIKTETIRKVYDGKITTSPGYEILGEYGLVSGQNIVKGPSIELIDVTENPVENSFIFTIQDEQGKDKTKFYEISYQWGEIEIRLREITIETKGQQKVYDELDLQIKGFTITSENKLALDETLIETTEYKVVGKADINNKVKNSFDFDIKNKEGNSTRKNYLVHTNWGILEIIPRPITISTQSKTKIYDGLDLSIPDYKILGKYGILPSQKLCISDIVVVNDICTDVLNKFTYKIEDKEGVNVTTCYKITEDWGKLTILPRKLVITTKSISKVYNDEYLECHEYTLNEGKDVGLCENQTLEISNWKKIIDAKKIDNDFDFVIKHGKKVTTTNYEITKNWGTLKITQRPITISTESAHKVYDDTILTKPGYTLDEYIVDKSGKLPTHSIKITRDFKEIIDAKTVENDIEFNIVRTEGELVVTKNYIITTKWGTLDITKRPITISTESAQKVYDDTILTKPGYTLDEYIVDKSGKLPTHSIKITRDFKEIIDAITEKNDIEFNIVRTEGELVVTQNYDIKRNWGTLKITRRPITIKTASASKTYDNTVLTKPGLIEEDTIDLVLGHKIKFISKWQEIINAGTVENNIEIDILRNDVDDPVTSNYEINREFGTLEVFKRDLIIHTESKTQLYDKLPLEAHGFTCEPLTKDTGLLSVHTIEVSKYTSIIDAGNVDNVFEFVIKNEKQEPVTDNYNIIGKWGKLEIIPRNISIITGSIEKIYDGKPIKNDEVPKVIELEEGKGFLPGDTLIFVSDFLSYTNAGTYKNTLEYQVIDEFGTDITKNYKVFENWGEIVINKRPVTLTTDGATKIYDGEPLSNEGYIISALAQDRGIIEGHKFVRTSDYKSIILPDTVDNDFTFDIVDKDGNSQIDNYEVDCIFGELIVKGMPIIIKTGTKSKIWDNTPLTYDDIQYDKKLLLEGHRFEGHCTGSIVDVGSTDNTFEYDIFDNENVSVKNLYDVTKELGKLIVVSKDGGHGGDGGHGDGGHGDGGHGDGGNEDGGSNNGPNEIDKSGGLLDQGFGNPGIADGNGNKVFFKFKTDALGSIYFRVTSFGDYDEVRSSFKTPKAFTSSIMNVNPLYFTALALNSTGKYKPNNIEFIINNDCDYLLPYFTVNGPVFANDYNNVIPCNSNYVLPFIPYYYNSKDNISLKGTQYEALENEYYQFVVENYLALPDTTRKGVEDILLNAGIKKDDPNVIEKVTSYLRDGSFKYNLYFDKIPEGEDFILYFLTKSHEGICQHFAASAVAMFRALGIPARYTEGFTADAVPGVEIPVTAMNAHAWCEIYIKGLGWVNIETTASSQFNDIVPTPGEIDPNNPENPENPDIDKPNPLKNTIIVKPIPQYKEYDGTPLCAVNELLIIPDTLLETLINQGYSYKVAVKGERTNVGTAISTVINFELFDAEGNPVDLKKYDVKYVPGELIVGAIKVNITIGSTSKSYDGTPLIYNKFEVERQNGLPLREGDVFEAINPWASIVDVGTIPNTNEFKVIDKNGNEVTKDYEINVIPGEIEITAISITIETESFSRQYNGEPLILDKYKITQDGKPYEFKDGDHIVIDNNSWKYIINVGSIENSVEYHILDINDKPVDFKYNVKQAFGTLEILSVNVTLITKTDSKVFDGTPLYGKEYKFVREDGNEGLLDGDELVCTSEWLSITNYGQIINEISYKIVNTDGKDITGLKYKVTEQWGTLDITRIKVIIRTQGGTKEYDGVPLQVIGCDFFREDGEPIRDGDKVKVLGEYPSLNEIKTIDNDFGKFIIVDKDDNDVTNEYDVITIWGKLSITKIKGKLVTGTRSKEYDGQPLDCKEFTFTKADGSTITNGDHIEVVNDFWPSIKDIVEIDNIIEFKVRDKDNNDISDMYDIVTEFGKLSITKKIINLTTCSAEKVYDGVPLVKEEFENLSEAESKLAQGHKFVFSDWSSLNTIQTIDNKVVAQVMENDLDVTNLYDIRYTYGTLTLTGIKLIVKTEGAIQEFNNVPLSREGVTNIDEINQKLREGDKFEVTSNWLTIDDIGSCTNSIEFAITDVNGKDSSMFYDISTDFGILLVTPIKLIIETGSDSKLYDGTPLTNSECHFDETKLIEGHKVLYTITGTITEVGSKENSIIYEIKDGLGKDVKEFYEVQLKLGTLEILDNELVEDPGKVDLSGNLSSVGQKPQIGNGYIFKYATNVNHNMYFRIQSFGDYNLNSWNIPTNTFNNTSDLNPLYFTSYALQNSKSPIYNQAQVQLLIDKGCNYELPYYTINGPQLENDYSNDINFNGNYSLDFIPYNYKEGDKVTLTGTQYEQIENEYYEFVRANYLALPQETLNGVNSVLQSAGINSSDPNVITKVKNYLQGNTFTYNKEFAPIPEGKDFVLYFLNESHEGICQHFASAGVAMFRALGIPARYTVGFMSNSIQDREILVTSNDCHAWVEIYIKGLGWVNVEVTGGSFSGSSENIPPIDVEEKSLVLQPVSVTKEYDGEPLLAKNELIVKPGSLLESLINDQSITIELAVKGSITNKGTAKSEITKFIVRNENGEDITNTYTIIKLPGDMSVTGRKITVTTGTTTKEYDGMPLSNTEINATKEGDEVALRNGDSIKVIGEWLSITEVGSIENIVEYIIVNSDGINVTDFYEITNNYGDLIITKRPLTIITGTATKEFDGQPLMCNDYKLIGSLREGETIDFVLEWLSITEVGEYENQIEVKIMNKDGKDVTNTYVILYEFGMLRVTEYQIIITTGSTIREYDGTPLINTEITITRPEGKTGLLRDGHSLQVDDNYPQRTLPGKTENLIKFKIVDNEGSDVTKLYHIDYRPGILEVTQIMIVIKTESDEKEYDGLPLTCEKYQIMHGSEPGLVLGHKINITKWASITTLGEIDNAIEFTIVDIEGNEVTKLYDINFEYGKLAVTKVKLVIKTESASQEYNGQPLSSKHYELIRADKSHGLIAGHEFNMVGDYKEITEIGKIRNDFEYVIKDQDGQDITDKYTIQTIWGILEVTKVKLTVATMSAEKYYDGLPLSSEEYEIKRIDGSQDLVLGDVFKIVGEFVVLDNIGTKKNHIDYIIEDKDKNDVTGRYDIINIEGILEIKKIPITITTLSAEKEYDGKPLSKIGFKETHLEGPGLMEGHKIINTTDWPELTEIDVISNKVDSTIVDENDVDVSEIYEITRNYGTLTVGKYIIFVKFGSATKEYDGTPLFNQEVSIKRLDNKELVEGDSIEVVDYLRITEISKVENNIIFNIVNSEGKNVTDNYSIIMESKGILEITKIHIKVETDSMQKYYDGKPLTSNIFNYDESKLLPGHKLIGNCTGSITDIGSCENTFECTIYDQNNINVSDLYEIDVKPGTLRIIEDVVEDTNKELNLDGQINHNGFTDSNGGSMGGANGNNIIFKFTSSSSGKVYFRVKSFGDYIINGWDNPLAFTRGNGLSPLYLATQALLDSGRTAEHIKFDIKNKDTNYELPYFTVNGPNFSNDYLTDFDFNDDYELDYIPYYYNEKDNIQITDPRYKELEEEYYAFIVSQYTKIPSSTKEGINKFLNEKGFDTNNKENLILRIAELVQNSATYNTEFSEYPKDSDIVLYFLNEAHEGICQHFASAAVAIYRALGIPARYTIGFTADAVKDREVPVTAEMAHAWVEVYIKGFGWVNIEATGGDNFTDPDPNGDKNEQGEKPDEYDPLDKLLIIKPENLSKEYDGTPLVSNNKLEVKKGTLLEHLLSQGYTYNIEVTGSITNIGNRASQITKFELFDENHVLVNDKFTIKLVDGELAITKRIITLVTKSASKEYDGKPLICEEYDLLKTKGEPLFAGHKFIVTSEWRRITDIGKETNSIEFKIVDEQMKNVTLDYDITIEWGELEVSLKKIIVDIGSKSKKDDGTPLTFKNYTVKVDNMPETHKLIVDVTGYLDKVGVVENTANAYIVDTMGRDVSSMYDLTVNFGKLEIYDKDIDMGGVKLDQHGNLSTKGELPPVDENGKALFTFTSDSDGMVYFRVVSFGDYNFRGWDPNIQSYPKDINGYSPLYLSSLALQENLYNSYNIEINMPSGMDYLLPYYTVDGPKFTGDRLNESEYNGPYNLKYIPYEYTNANRVTLENSIYKDAEAEYCKYVYENYLSLPNSTKDGMLKIANEHKLFASNPNIINEVARYISHAAKYNINYDEIPDGVDIALYFLNESKEGICQHFATAAVAMYRALGIPARYTIGWAKKSNPHKVTKVGIPDAHAWVEVYVKGMGWVNIEATGSGFSGFGGGEPDTSKPILMIKPEDINKGYDGNPLYASNNIDLNYDPILKDLIENKGYTYYLRCEGSRIDIGESDSIVCEFKLFDDKRNDVTDQYEYQFINGKITITKEQIEFIIFSYQKTYDGVGFTYCNDDVYIKAPSDVFVTYNLTGEVKNYGKTEGKLTDIKVTNLNGDDITDNYFIKIVPGTLTIDKIEIEITTASDEKFYDGTPLTNNNWTMSGGELLEGHRLEVETAGSITDIGEEVNSIKSAKVFDKDGNDVTEYYIIDYENTLGTLKIK